MDEAALREAYRRFAPVVYRRALQLLRDEDDAVDVTQDVFERLVCGRHKGVEGRALLLWMYRVATNLCLNRIRDSRRRNTLLNAHADAFPAGSPAASVPRVDAIRTVIRLVGDAPEREIMAAVYCHVDGMTQDEAAETLGVTSRTIRNLLRRLEKRARKAAGQESGP